MKTNKFLSLSILALLVFTTANNTFAQRKSRTAQSISVPLENATLVGDEKITTPYGVMELQHNYLTDESSQKLFDAMDLQRASQAYMWSTPLVSFVTWREEQNKHYGPNARGTFAVFVSFREKQGIVTANLTTPYFISFENLSKGPLQIEYPAGMTAGAALDFWQRPIADLGLTGPDRGEGGTYIIVGPEDDPKKYEKRGVFVVQSATNNIMWGFRILDTAPEFKSNFVKALKVSALGGQPVQNKLIEGLDKEWSATAYRGMDYWKALHDVINQEPVREQDKVWMAMIEPLGIVKGKPFNPDARQTKILMEGAALGELMARNLQINPRFTEPYWPGTQWYKSIDFSIPQINYDKVELDERTVWFYEAVTSSEGMVNPYVGKGQIYMTAKRDSKGKLLRADKTYRLRIPADVPTAQFWSVDLYSEDTRRHYESDGTVRSVAINSRMQDIKRNPDGSVDLYIGAKAPAGYESNYMKTVGTDGWFVYFRLYAPLEPFFDKTFSLPDFEEIN
ncbi:DUF1254 domain-containing protein [Cecembia lonarensis]|uniref:DUF1254 domain-containing protein n=1 Tax=Cecembia lonarensis (strain CCUG 58316 / KCTC 22772 / LW9) TaxID=1225176 RepID=K1L8B6_CECL9|nr:DUF1254 domain-containing protein [Cecembia lonarensis]EKB50951.1 hypothetical protein B879_00479 [Cecembia lonarensis LW9]